MKGKLNMSDTEFSPKFLKKLQKGAPDFTDSANAMQTDDLKALVLKCEKSIVEIDKAKDEDHKLNAAKEVVKSFGKPYSESKALETAKIKYCMYVLESRGN